jgi:hypothetical protein
MTTRRTLFLRLALALAGIAAALGFGSQPDLALARRKRRRHHHGGGGGGGGGGY